MAELDPQAAALLQLGRDNPAPALESLPLAEMRQGIETSLPLVGVPTEAVSRVIDITVAGPHGAITVRRYRPADSADESLPAVLFLHGGGWACCSLETHDSLCRHLCNAVGAEFLAVDYRLAPEHRFPVAAEDACAVLAWLVEHAPSGVDVARLAVCGDSAGGNLAAVVANSVLGRRVLSGQWLLYPVLDVSRRWPAHDRYGSDYFLDESTMEWFTNQYAANVSDRSDERCSPLLTGDLSGVAPACLQIPEFDIHRDSAFEYARRLTEAGVSVQVLHYPSLAHGFASMAGVIGAGRDALGDGVRFLRQCLRVA